MNSTSASISLSLKPTGLQMRVCSPVNSLIGISRTPSLMSTSHSTRASWPACGVPTWSPTYSAACDQVDWLRYLIAVENRVLPSTSSTSPLRNAAATRLRGLVGRCEWLALGFDRKRARWRPNRRNGDNIDYCSGDDRFDVMARPVRTWPRAQGASLPGGNPPRPTRIAAARCSAEAAPGRLAQARVDCLDPVIGRLGRHLSPRPRRRPAPTHSPGSAACATADRPLAGFRRTTC